MSGLNISFRIQAIDDFSNTMSKLNDETKKAFDKVGNIGKGFTVAGAGVAAGLGVAVKTATDFNAQMSRVSAISGATGDQLEDLRKTALDLGASTSKSASEVAIGMEEMAKKGFEVNEVISAMPGIIAASEASGEDLAVVSNVVASALNSFHLEASEASRVADVMAMAANKSSADVNDLGYAFKYAAPLANTLGYSMETLAAATGIMTDAGLEGQQAGTTLRMAMIRLTDPPKEAAKALEDMGIQITDTAGNMLPFDQIIQQLADSTSGMGDAAKLAALSQIFGAEAASGMLTVIDAGADKLRTFTGELENSEGSAHKTATAMKDNLKGSVEQLSGAFETLMISMGTALTPAIQALTVALTSLVNWFNGLPAPVQTTLTVIVALTAAFLLILGPILILVAMIPAITAGFTAVAGAVGLTAGALVGVIGIVLGVIAAIALIGVALVVAYNKVGWFRDMVNSAWESIKSAWNTALNFITNLVKSIMTDVSSFIGSQLTKIKDFWQQNGDNIKKIVTVIFLAIYTQIRTTLALIQAVITVAWNVIKGVTVATWNMLKGVISGALDIILGIIQVFVSVLTGDWQGAWDGVKQITRGAIEVIASIVKGMFNIGKNIISGLTNGIKSAAGKLLSTAKDIASKVTSTIKKAFNINSPSRVMDKEVGRWIPPGIADGILGSLGVVKKAAESVVSAAVPEIPTPSMSSYSAQKVSSGKYNGQQITNNSPINLTLNYNGNGSESDAYSMIDIIERELGNRMGNKMRISGVKGWI